MTLTVLHLFPDELGASGDSGNVQTVVYRLRERGLDVSLVTYAGSGSFPAHADAVFIGNGPWAAALRVIDKLTPHRSTLQAWFSDAIPFFAVGTGAEVLATTIEDRDSRVIEGLGLFPFRVQRDRGRLVAYNACTSRFGQIVGFSDLSSEWHPDESVEPLGTCSIGPDRVIRNDGLIVGSSIATQIGGPVLALNPHLADRVCAQIAATAGEAFSPTSLPTDELAANARRVILDNMDQVFTTIAL